MRKDEQDNVQTSSRSGHLRALDLQVIVPVMLESVIRLCLAGCLFFFAPSASESIGVKICLSILSSLVSFSGGFKQFLTNIASQLS